MDQCCEELDVKVLSEIKGIVQFYSQHAACSHELFSDLWIDAGGEKAADERTTETECGCVGFAEHVLKKITAERGRIKKQL